MKRSIVKIFSVIAAVMFMSLTVLEISADARAGGGRSMGSRGARSFSSPARPAPQPSQPGQYSPAPGPAQQQAGGGLMRGMAGGLMGGMLGSMLLGGTAGADSNSGNAGGGIGLLEILLLAGAGYLIYRYIRKKKADDYSAR